MEFLGSNIEGIKCYGLERLLLFDVVNIQFFKLLSIFYKEKQLKNVKIYFIWIFEFYGKICFIEKMLGLFF